MALTIGTDSYVTLEEATQYAESHLLSSDPRKAAWESLTDPDKEVLLRNATSTIDSLPLRGRKIVATQALAFPRTLQEKCQRYFGCFEPIVPEEDSVVPSEVKRAQCEQALQFALSLSTTSSATASADAEARAALQRQGVTSFSLGDLSESYSGMGTGSYLYDYNSLSTSVLSLLSKWLGGGYDICR